MENKEQAIKNFQSYFCPFGYLDIWTALEAGDEVGLDEEEIFDIVQAYQSETETPLDKIDVVALVYDHILREASHVIEEHTRETPEDFGVYVAGNFMCTSFDNTEDFKIRREEQADVEVLKENEYVKFLLDNI